MGKLVRDLVPTVIEADGRQADIRVLDRLSYQAALHDKLLEEAGELREAEPGMRLEELADVYEVLRALAIDSGHAMSQVRTAAAMKRERRGGFENRIWLESW